MKIINNFALPAIAVFILCFSVMGQDKTAAPAATPVPAATPTAPATAAPAQKPKMPTPLPADLVSFFSGEWEGAGKFANGKEIKADVKFSPELDNQWLLYSHRDQAPNKYKALGMWGIERVSDKFLMIVEDNFGGTRRFESDGWRDGKIAFTFSNPAATTTFIERFTFEKQTDKTFKMTYEVSRDGAQWRMGDYLVFTRK